MRGVVLSVVLPRLCLGQTDVGREIDIECDKRDLNSDVVRGQDVYALHTPLRSKDCVEVQIAAG